MTTEPDSLTPQPARDGPPPRPPKKTAVATGPGDEPRRCERCGKVLEAVAFSKPTDTVCRRCTAFMRDIAAPPDKTRGLPYSVATETDVACPRCHSEFQVSPEFYDAVAECPKCALTFVIKSPDTPPYEGPVPGRMS
jgi:uncharacterized paraquat-inducible protein A